MDGYCPRCGDRVSGPTITTGGRGLCERHGWVFVNWTKPTGLRVLDWTGQLIRENDAVEDRFGHVIGYVVRVDSDELGPFVDVQYAGERYGDSWPAYQDDPRDDDPDVFVCEDVTVTVPKVRP